MSFHLSDPCLWCIEGSSPAGIHDILGPVYKPCPVCLGACALCEGDGLFPADFACLPCFRQQLAAQGLAPIMCAHCSGVVDLIPLDAIPAPEVTPHGHH
ncbi:hypothetical protein O7614_04940 [Micromonospora sp. WMMD961]|uniref:Uncharacterized protein n=2 Tax=Micromonospora TaxID=1873 RepID=A0A1C4UPB8_9ACTN|nr:MULTISPECIES: hypothetical protein [Micromonospora]MDG4778990.1 hypothetical protein [Micromonospora sp. WMMD961]SCE73505.1 hypothetical protein GA0070612_0618 [Micromonospora chokoriensis]